MVVGMPNVGKSSLINILRGQATKKQRLGGGLGEDVKKVPREAFVLTCRNQDYLAGISG